MEKLTYYTIYQKALQIICPEILHHFQAEMAALGDRVDNLSDKCDCTLIFFFVYCWPQIVHGPKPNHESISYSVPPQLAVTNEHVFVPNAGDLYQYLCVWPVFQNIKNIQNESFYRLAMTRQTM